MADERPWYFSDRTVIIAVLALMAFALPLVWFSPYYSMRRKFTVSVIVIVVTYFSWQMTMDSLKTLQSYYNML